MLVHVSRRWLMPLVVAIAVPLLLVGAVPAAALANDPEQPRPDWRDCPDNPALKCASFDVPLDHAAPDGAQVRLALVMAPAADPERRLGSIVVNRGGPGLSSTEYLRLIVEEQVPSPVDQRVWDRFDVIGLDQRGVGDSRPAVTCFESPEEREQFSAGVSILPVDAREARLRSAKDAEFAARCRQHTGDLLDHTSTAIAARDLDLVRQALGDRRLNFLGQSYGVHLGLAYANLFPAHVGSFVLDSAGLVGSSEATGAGGAGVRRPARL